MVAQGTEGRAALAGEGGVVQQQEDRAAQGPPGEDKVVRRREGRVEACQQDRAVPAADFGVVQVLAEGVGLVHLQSAGPPQWWAVLPQSVCG